MFLKLALLVLLPSFCIGQSQKIADSLYDIYSNKSLNDDETMVLLGSMAYNEINDFEKAISYSDELIALAKKNNNFKQLQKGYYQKAISLRYLGNLSQAL